VVLAVLLSILPFALLPQPAQAHPDPWWDTDWQYRMPIYIINTNPSTLTNYQVRITLQTTNFNYSHAKTNGEDIRFICDDGITQCDYWIETWNASGTSTLWVEVPTLIGGSEMTTIYMYYGNSGASAASNGTATFQFFDDFLGTTIDTGKWTGDTGSCSVADSVVTLTATGGNPADRYVYSINNYGPNIRIRSKEQRPEADPSTNHDADVGVKTNGSWTDAVRTYNYGSAN